MTRAAVKSVLDALGCFRYTTDVRGFVLHVALHAHGFVSGSDYRLQKGSGIAGDNRWFLQAVRGEDRDTRGPVSTRRDLRRIVIELLAGPKPVPLLPGWTVHAKLNHNRYGSHYVWCYRKPTTPARQP